MRHGGVVQAVVDAVVPEEHLADLEPKKNGKRWALNCPHCGERGRAYLTEGRSFIGCNRKNKCGEVSSLINLIANGSPEVLRGSKFTEALTVAAAKLGIEVPERASIAKDAELLRAALCLAEKYAVKHIQGGAPDAVTALAYLQTRGLTLAHCVELGVGFLAAHIPMVVARKLGGDALTASGVEHLKNHIVVLARDRYGNPVGAHGRLPRDAGPGPKTWTAAGTSKAVPFLLDRVSAAGHTEVLVVEGLLDGLVAHAYKIENVVALLGAEVTESHVRELLATGVGRVTLCLDADDAGLQGTLRAIHRLEQAGIETFVAPPLGVDETEVV